MARYAPIDAPRLSGTRIGLATRYKVHAARPIQLYTNQHMLHWCQGNVSL